MYLVVCELQAGESLVQIDLLDGLLPLLAEREMSQQNRRLEAQRIHILRSSSVDLSTSVIHPTHPTLAVPLTNPAAASAAHCASASHGASTYGIPMSLSNILQSSFCSLVTLTVRLANFSTSSAFPASFASANPASACAFLATRFASSPDFSVGGFPSKTYSGLFRTHQPTLSLEPSEGTHFIPLSTILRVR